MVLVRTGFNCSTNLRYRNLGEIVGYFTTKISIFNKLADRTPQQAETIVTCEIDYTVVGEYDIEMELSGAVIDYGNAKHFMGEDSIWWPVLEAIVAGSEALNDEIYEQWLKRMEGYNLP